LKQAAVRFRNTDSLYKKLASPIYFDSVLRAIVKICQTRQALEHIPIAGYSFTKRNVVLIFLNMVLFFSPADVGVGWIGRNLAIPGRLPKILLLTYLNVFLCLKFVLANADFALVTSFWVIKIVVAIIIELIFITLICIDIDHPLDF
jgi:hypothetical protein